MTEKTKNTTWVIFIICALLFLLNIRAFFSNKNNILNELEKISRLENTAADGNDEPIIDFIQINSPLSFFDSAFDELNLKANLKDLQIIRRGEKEEILIRLEDTSWRGLTDFFEFIKTKKIKYPYYIEITPKDKTFNLTVRITL